MFLRDRATALAVAGAIALAAVVGAAWWMALELGSGLDFDLHSTAATIRGWGQWGILGSIGLMVLHSFVPFPAEILACANGLVYGPVWGALITWIGAMLGAVAAYALARQFGSPLVKRLLTRRQSDELSKWAGRQGAGAMLLARLMPIIAFNLINYAAALAGIGWWTFLWTTGLGILPMTVLTAVLGDRVLSVSPWIWAATGAVIVLAALLMHVRRRRIESARASDAAANHP